MIDIAGVIEQMNISKVMRDRYRRVFGRPSQVHISITDRCNMKCSHCDIWMKPKPGELEGEDWKKVISQLRNWLGPFTLKIAGGEPLVKKGVLDLIAHARSLGCHTGLSTNGLSIGPDMAGRIVESGLDEIHISLESATPSHHDSLRGSPGSHEKIVAGIGELNRRRGHIRINIATVITEGNLGELTGIVEFVKDNGLYTVNFQPLYQNFGQVPVSGWHIGNRHFPRSLSLLDRVLDELIEVRKTQWLVGNTVNQLEMMKVYFRNPDQEARIECMAGVRDIAFDPYGNLLLCFWLDPVGNVKENGKKVKAIYFSEESRRRRREIKRCRRNCNLLNCNFERNVFGDMLEQGILRK